MRPAIRSLKYTCPPNTLRTADRTLTVASSLVIYPSAPGPQATVPHTASRRAWITPAPAACGHSSFRFLMQFQAAGPLERNVQDHQVRRLPADQRQGGRRIRGLPAHFQIRLPLNQRRQVLPHQRVIVHQEYSGLPSAQSRSTWAPLFREVFAADRTTDHRAAGWARLDAQRGSHHARAVVHEVQSHPAGLLGSRVENPFRHLQW